MKNKKHLAQIESEAIRIYTPGRVSQRFIELEKEFEKAGGTRGGYVSLYMIAHEAHLEAPVSEPHPQLLPFSDTLCRLLDSFDGTVTIKADMATKGGVIWFHKFTERGGRYLKS